MIPRARLLAAWLLVGCCAPQAVHAQANAVVFDGETYLRMHAERQSSGNRVVQFLRKQETFGNWTRSIGYYRYATIGNDPTQAAYDLREAIRAANPDAQTRITLDTVTRDVMIDFLTWPGDGRHMEFTVVRYSWSADGKGLVAFQFSYRFRDPKEEDAPEFIKSRLSWKAQVLEYDMVVVRAAFGD